MPLPLLLPFLPTPPRPREGHPEPAIDAREIPHTPIHIDLHPPLPSASTSITIPPQGFLARGSPPWGAARAHTHLTLSHASNHQLNRPIVHRWSWTPAVYPHRQKGVAVGAATTAQTILSATSSIVMRLEPPRCLAWHKDWRAPSVLPPNGTWTIGLHNPTSPTPCFDSISIGVSLPTTGCTLHDTWLCTLHP